MVALTWMRLRRVDQEEGLAHTRATHMGARNSNTKSARTCSLGMNVIRMCGPKESLEGSQAIYRCMWQQHEELDSKWDCEPNMNRGLIPIVIVV